MALFDFMRRRKAAPPPAPAGQALTMVLLPHAGPVNGAAAFEHLRATWAGSPTLSGVETKEGATTADVEGGHLALLHVPFPVPAGDLEGPVALAWHWPQAREVTAAHQSHVIVHAAGTAMSMVDLRLLHTRLAAAVLETAGGSGVYLGDAMLVRSAEDFAADARTASRSTLPLLSWVGFFPIVERGRTTGYTRGMSGFGLLELEIRDSKMPPHEVLGTLADAAHYQLSTGRVLRDGDTYGENAGDRNRVRHVRSSIVPEITVALLEM